MKFKNAAIFIMLTLTMPLAKAKSNDNLLAPAVAFLAGCGINAALKNRPKLKNTANCVIGGAYLIAPLVNLIGFAFEQTIYRAQYKKETYDFSAMFPELFLSYCGGSLLGTVLTQETNTDKQDQDQMS